MCLNNINMITHVHTHTQTHVHIISNLPVDSRSEFGDKQCCWVLLSEACKKLELKISLHAFSEVSTRRRCRRMLPSDDNGWRYFGTMSIAARNGSRRGQRKRRALRKVGEFHNQSKTWLLSGERSHERERRRQSKKERESTKNRMTAKAGGVVGVDRWGWGGREGEENPDVINLLFIPAGRFREQTNNRKIVGKQQPQDGWIDDEILIIYVRVCVYLFMSE